MKNKIVKLVKKSKRSLLDLINEVILCFESNLKEERGKMQAEEGLSMLFKLMTQAIESKHVNKKKEEMEAAIQAIVNAQKRLAEGNFGNVTFENYSVSFESDNIFKEILKKCA